MDHHDANSGIECGLHKLHNSVSQKLTITNFDPNFHIVHVAIDTINKSKNKPYPVKPDFETFHHVTSFKPIKRLDTFIPNNKTI